MNVHLRLHSGAAVVGAVTIALLLTCAQAQVPAHPTAAAATAGPLLHQIGVLGISQQPTVPWADTVLFKVIELATTYVNKKILNPSTDQIVLQEKPYTVDSLDELSTDDGYPVDQAVLMYYPPKPASPTNPTNSKVEAFILSPEALLLENVAQLSEFWQVPVFAGGSQLGLITETSVKYDMLQSLVNIGFSKNQLALAVISVIAKFSWTHITIVSDLSSGFYEELASRIDMTLRTPSNYTGTTLPIYARRYWLSISLTAYAQADYEADVLNVLQQASLNSRIFILCMNGDKVRTFLYYAYKYGYCTADYVYFGFEPYYHPTFGNFGIVPLLSASQNGMVMDSTVTVTASPPINYALPAGSAPRDIEIANITQAYRSLIKVTLSMLPNAVNADMLYSAFPFFLSYDTKKTKIPYATWWAANRHTEIGTSFIYAAFYYDAVLLLGAALKYAIANPPPPVPPAAPAAPPVPGAAPVIVPSSIYAVFTNWPTINGNQAVIGDSTLQSAFIQQNYAFGDDCVKLTKFSFEDFDVTLTDWYERGSVVIQTGQPTAALTFNEQNFEWSYQEASHAPPNEPACGFRGEKCYVLPTWVIPLVIGICSVIGFFLLLALTIAIYRHATQFKRLKHRAWYINNEDVKILAIASGFEAYSSYLLSAGKSTASAASAARSARGTDAAGGAGGGGGGEHATAHAAHANIKAPHYLKNSERHTSEQAGGGGKGARITFGGVNNPTHVSTHSGGGGAAAGGAAALHRSTLRQRGAAARGGVANSSMRLPMAAGSTTALVENLVSSGQFSLAVVKYRNQRCAGRRMLLVRLFFNKIIVREIEHLMSFNHENLVRTYGFVPGPPAVWIVEEYFTKGSVADLLQNPNMELDWNFKLSILEDIARGVKAIHEGAFSNQKSTGKNGDGTAHGRLRTTNCLVNDRFGIKISGFGVPTTRQKNFNERAKDAAYSSSEMCKLLWIAPELLLLIDATTPAAKATPSSTTAVASTTPGTGNSITDQKPASIAASKQQKQASQQRGIYFGKTKEGDTYSFGIIVAELWSHLPPYHEQMVMGVPISTILSAVQVGTSPVTRPKVEEDIPLAPRALLQLMKDCWYNDKTKRPSFIEISRQLQHITQRLATAGHAAVTTNNPNSSGVGVSILDSLLRQMEMHSKRLEKIVQERTQELAESKAETEKILHELVPPTITKRLLAGADIEPERFENVTVCISRIAGFHKLCSTLSAIHSASFFNKLSALLDSTVADHPRVYKVDVILDMYVCAAGVPIPSKRHAWEICEVALALQHRAATFHSKLLPPGHVIQTRCGIHSGSVVAGIVGSKVPRYGLYGPTITATLALEAHALPSHILCSLPAYKAIKALPKNRFVLEQTSRRLEVFGVGLFTTYWLRGHADKRDSESVDSVVLADDDEDENEDTRKTNGSDDVDEEMSKMMELYQKPTTGIPHHQPQILAGTLPAGVKSALGVIADTITEEEEEEEDEEEENDEVVETEIMTPSTNQTHPHPSELYLDALDNPAPTIVPNSPVLAQSVTLSRPQNASIQLQQQDRLSKASAGGGGRKSGKKRNTTQRSSKNRSSRAKSSMTADSATSVEKLKSSQQTSEKRSTLTASKRISQNSTMPAANLTNRTLASSNAAASGTSGGSSSQRPSAVNKSNAPPTTATEAPHNNENPSIIAAPLAANLVSANSTDKKNADDTAQP